MSRRVLWWCDDCFRWVHNDDLDHCKYVEHALMPIPLAALCDAPEVCELVWLLEQVEKVWRFDDAQQQLSSWHDREDFLEAVRPALRPFQEDSDGEDDDGE